MSDDARRRLEESGPARKGAPVDENDRESGLFGFPRLTRAERKELVERVEEGSRPHIDFVVMMLLSVGLASLGLLQGSGAVVIGAMLVAPLMGPLVGAGLALTHANAKLLRTSMLTTMIGLTVGFVVSMLIGLGNPEYEPSMEI